MFDTPADYKGAYIQIQANDGTVADDYFDIVPGAKSLRNSKNGEEQTDIDVDFSDDVPPGKFCYIICVYDNAGNISQPIEVCVEIEAWGGNDDLVAIWNETKEVVTYQGESTTYTVGVERCDPSTIFCDNQDELVVENAYCQTIDLSTITFNEDGTFSSQYNDSSIDFDYNKTVEQCEVAFLPKVEDTYSEKGNWAYDEEEKILTLITFEEEDNGEITRYDNGEGYSIGTFEVTATTLQITDDETDEVIVTYFEKQ